MVLIAFNLLGRRSPPSPEGRKIGALENPAENKFITGQESTLKHQNRNNSAAFSFAVEILAHIESVAKKFAIFAAPHAHREIRGKIVHPTRYVIHISDNRRIESIVRLGNERVAIDLNGNSNGCNDIFAFSIDVGGHELHDQRGSPATAG